MCEDMRKVKMGQWLCQRSSLLDGRLAHSGQHDLRESRGKQHVPLPPFSILFPPDLRKLQERETLYYQNILLWDTHTNELCWTISLLTQKQQAVWKLQTRVHDFVSLNKSFGERKKTQQNTKRVCVIEKTVFSQMSKRSMGLGCQHTRKYCSPLLVQMHHKGGAQHLLNSYVMGFEMGGFCTTY